MCHHLPVSVSECSTGLSGRIREMETRSLGSQAQVGWPWPAIMTARRLSAHVNLTLCHLFRRGESSSLELAHFRKLPVNQRSPGGSHLHPGGWVTHLLPTDMLSTPRMLKLFFSSLFLRTRSADTETQQCFSFSLELLIINFWKTFSQKSNSYISTLSSSRSLSVFNAFKWKSKIFVEM